MSHMSTLNCEVKSRSAITRALRAEGIPFVENQGVSSYGTSSQYEIAFADGSRALRIGFIKNPNGTYRCEHDTYGTKYNANDIQKVIQQAVRFQYDDAFAEQGVSVTWSWNAQGELCGVATL